MIFLLFPSAWLGSGSSEVSLRSPKASLFPQLLQIVWHDFGLRKAGPT